MVGHVARLQFEVAECVETKTVTTTTTTKRSYPPIFIKEPRPLSSLDSKEYPLASRPTPPELTRFTFDVGGLGGEPWSFDDELPAAQVCIVLGFLTTFPNRLANIFWHRYTVHKAPIIPVLSNASLESTAPLPPTNALDFLTPRLRPRYGDRRGRAQEQPLLHTMQPQIGVRRNTGITALAYIMRYPTNYAA